MILFWSLALLMIVIGLLIILPALLKQRRPKLVQRDVLNAAIYQDQLAELAVDLNNESLSPEQFEQGRRDLERNLLADVSTAQDQAASSVQISTTGRVTAIVLGVALPVLAVSIYLKLGNSDQIFSAQPMANVQPEDMAAMGGLTPELMVQRLEARLKTHPQDGVGWAMLGRSHSVLGRFAEASQAYAKALPLMGEDAQLFADYAEALALSNTDQQLMGQPTEFLEKALKLDPNNHKGLWLAGMAAFQKQDFQRASDYWRRLSEVIPADSEDAETIKRRIADAEALAARDTVTR